VQSVTPSLKIQTDYPVLSFFNDVLLRSALFSRFGRFVYRRHLRFCLLHHLGDFDPRVVETAIEPLTGFVERLATSPAVFRHFFGVLRVPCLGFASFSLPFSFSYLLSLPMTLFVNGLVWAQLQRLLVQLEQGGSKALDLDSLSLGEVKLPSRE